MTGREILHIVEHVSESAWSDLGTGVVLLADCQPRDLEMEQAIKETVLQLSKFRALVLRRLEWKGGVKP